MNVKLIALVSLLLVTLLQQGCIVARVATAPVRYAAHRVEIARARKQGEKRGEEKAEARAAAPQHIERPDMEPPAAPVDVPAN